MVTKGENRPVKLCNRWIPNTAIIRDSYVFDDRDNRRDNDFDS